MINSQAEELMGIFALLSCTLVPLCLLVLLIVQFFKWIPCTVLWVEETTGTARIGFSQTYVRMELERDSDGEKIHIEGWVMDLGSHHQGEKLKYYPFTGEIRSME